MRKGEERRLEGQSRLSNHRRLPISDRPQFHLYSATRMEVPKRPAATSTTRRSKKGIQNTVGSSMHRPTLTVTSQYSRQIGRPHRLFHPSPGPAPPDRNPVQNPKQQTGLCPTTQNIPLQPHSAHANKSASAETTHDAQRFSPPPPQAC